MQRPQQEKQSDITEFQMELVKQLQDTGCSPRILAAFLHVPRHPFVPMFYERQGRQKVLMQPSEMDAQAWLGLIYRNRPLITRIDDKGIPQSSSSQPGIMAEMLEALHIHPGHRILEIGTGTGYNAAILAYLTGDPRLVTTIDIASDLVEQARPIIESRAGAGMTVIAGDGLAGVAQYAPYDRLIATGSYPQVPYAWIDQLASDGLLIMNLQRRLLNIMLLVRKHGYDSGATGKILHTAGDFMKLHGGVKDGKPQITPGPIQPVIEELTPQSFHASNLEHHDFSFFLQCHLPHVQYYKASSRQGEQLIYLHDPDTDRWLQFYCNTVRGSEDLWQQLLAIALDWQYMRTLMRFDFAFEVEDGHQFFTYGEHRWIIA